MREREDAQCISFLKKNAELSSARIKLNTPSGKLNRSAYAGPTRPLPSSKLPRGYARAFEKTSSRTKGRKTMEIRSIRRDIPMLRIYVSLSTMAALE